MVYHNDYYNMIFSLHVFDVVIFLVALVLVFLILSHVFSKRKSKEYRQLLADMYVSGKIKKIAKEDEIDLVLEEESFRRWLKKQRLEELELDVAIEEQLKEQLEEEKFNDLKKKK